MPAVVGGKLPVLVSQEFHQAWPSLAKIVDMRSVAQVKVIEHADVADLSSTACFSRLAVVTDVGEPMRVHADLKLDMARKKGACVFVHNPTPY